MKARDLKTGDRFRGLTAVDDPEDSDGPHEIVDVWKGVYSKRDGSEEPCVLVKTPEYDHLLYPADEDVELLD